MNLLVVEDDPSIGKSLRQGLEESGHSCEWARDGQSGFQLAMTQRFDAVILDLMLPEMSGNDLLHQLRLSGNQTPVLILTALGEVHNRVDGLTKGADDYIVKPFALPELLARIDAVCRRSANKPSPQLETGDLQLDLAKRRVTRAGREIELTPTEFSLLEYLMRHEGQVVTRRMICEHLWESDWEGVTNVIEVHINRLRGKIDKGQEKSLIHTVRGRGYALRRS